MVRARCAKHTLIDARARQRLTLIASNSLGCDPPCASVGGGGACGACGTWGGTTFGLAAGEPHAGALLADMGEISCEWPLLEARCWETLLLDAAGLGCAGCASSAEARG